MDNLAEELLKQLNCETVFTIPIFGGIEVSESVVVTWIIMAFLVLISILLTRKLKVNNISKRQAIVELIVTKIDGLIEGMLGHNGKPYVPYMMSVLIYISLADIMSIFGMKPPTKDLNVTIALAVMSIILIEFAGIRQHGFKKWLKGFSKPVAIITPLNILEVIIRPLSLCMRLFGNVLGGFVIMELIKLVAPIGVPVIFSFYFDIFDGIIQAYVFVFLTSLFIKEATE